MLSDAEVKNEFKKKAQQHPEQYYPVETLKELGFKRKQCACCQWFWTTINAQHCGEPACSGGFGFIGNSPAKKRLSYTDVWKRFSKIHEKLGYTPIKRYPVVARWNSTVDFTIASIAAFQPFVVTGEVEPPANPLIIPQFCLRFPDIDNVGITGHHVGFVMMGQHAFVQPENYNKDKYVKDHLEWLNQGMGLSNEDIIVHEDSWAGGGNFGPCVEFFSKGLEISNQVYMQYEVTSSGAKELKIKVLDMGQGQERAAWFTQGKASIYETSFPDVVKKLRDLTGVEFDEEFMKKFAPLSSLLNVQEVSDINLAWNNVAKKLSMNLQDLRKKILPLAGLYSVAEHTRALLISIHDGALPSNVGGMYNLRVILRRALSFIDRYKWNIDICDVAEWHVKELKEQYPELEHSLISVRKILEVEKLKYNATKQKTASTVQKVIDKDLTTEKLIELYDSQGITPELLKEEAEKINKEINVPENFYSLVADRHAGKEQETSAEREEKIYFGSVNPTSALYFGDWKLVECRSKVASIKDKYVVLDQTVFYPVSGGQIHDEGTINGQKVIDVFKQDTLIVHKLAEKPNFFVNDTVNCKVDFERRKQLTQHHTSTHIINASARKVLGLHINQASAKKAVDHAYIDVTHYELISDEDLKKIEDEANNIVKSCIPIIKLFMPRSEAEKKYTPHIYQGGVAPGKELRIVNIENVEVEACGGTHLNNTSEAELIKILKSTKVKDGVVRIFFVAGKAAKDYVFEQLNLISALAKELDVPPNRIPSRAEELFEKWKLARKAVNKDKQINLKELELSKKEIYSGDIVKKLSELLKTQPEYLVKSIQRFKREFEEFKNKLKH